MGLTVRASLSRNEAGRLLVGGIRVRITPFDVAVEPAAPLAPSGGGRPTSVSGG